MNQDIISGKWKEIKGKIHQQWGEITDDDVAKMKGTQEELQGLLQKKCGYQREAAEQEINNFVKKNGFDKH
jgi:uncharacterized protein YjbJ (UPF0337 family)